MSRSEGGGAGEKCGFGLFLEMLVCRLRVDRGIERERAGAQSLVLQASPEREGGRERDRDREKRERERERVDVKEWRGAEGSVVRESDTRHESSLRARH